MHVLMISDVFYPRVNGVSTSIQTFARAKDMGSAAVFLSLVLVLMVWGLIAWDRFG